MEAQNRFGSPARLAASVLSFAGAGGTAGAALHTAAQLAIPLLLGAIVDDALLTRDAGALARLALLLVLAASVSTAGKALHEISFRLLAERGAVELHHGLLAHVQRLPIASLDGRHSGEIHALFSQDVPALARLAGPTIGHAVSAVLQLTALMSLLATRYGWLALLAFLLAPVYVAFPLLFSRRTREAAAAGIEARSAVYASLQEILQSVREVKVFGRESWTLERLAPHFRTSLRAALREQRIRSAYSLNYVLYFAVGAGVYWLGGQRVIDGRMSVGDLVALVALFGYLDRPINQVATLNAEVQASLAARQRIRGVLELPTERPLDIGVRLGKGAHAVRLEGVGFTYPGADHPALEDVHLEIGSGERFAIVGSSGSGKSTLLGFLLGLHAPDRGRLSIDGREMGCYSLRSIRERIALVAQEPVLFDGTVAENIRFGRLEATDAEVVESARIANALEFIERLPGGFDSEIGERGVRLSGGQRQRLAIARAVLRDPGILLLDEATSALDAESERMVQRGLVQAMRRRTCVVVAHRLAPVIDADRIGVLEQGRLIAVGNHRELLRDCLVYRRLCRLQLLDIDAHPARQLAAGNAG